MVKRKYITFKVDEDLPGVASLPEGQGRAQEPFNVRFGRCMRFCGFCCVCTGTLFQALAPWMLSVIEVVSLLLLYMLLVLPYRPPGPYSFDFHSSLEDVVLLGGLRAAVLAAAYACGSTRLHLRPYLYSSYVCGAVCLLYVGVKACLYSYPLAWLPPAALMTTAATFSWLNILAARYTVHWYRRRGQLGLLHTPALAHSSTGRRTLGGSLSGRRPAWLEPGSAADLPPELLADSDSRFLDVDGLKVHFKEALPAAAHGPACPRDAQQQPSAAAAAADSGGAALACGEECVPGPLLSSDTAVVLLHGFAGGEFAWRHVLQPLADAVGVRVVALDRPGFGLTSRPAPVTSSNSGGLQPRLGPPRSSNSSSSTQPLLPTHHQQMGQGSSPDAECPHQQQQWQQQGGSSGGGGDAAADPYSVPGQAAILLRFCVLLGLKRVLLVAHADGCMVAAHAAAVAAPSSRGPGSTQPLQQQQQHERNTQRSMPASSSSGSTCCEADEQQWQQQQHGGGAGVPEVLQPVLPRPPCSAGSAASSSHGSGACQQQPPGSTCPHSIGGSKHHGGVEVVGLALLHPDPVGHQLPAGLTRLLAASSMGRSVLRPLLRSQVGLLTARRAWAHPDLVSREVLSLYERPLRVEGWERGLLAACRATASSSHRHLVAQLEAVQHLPMLLVTGGSDCIATPSRLASIAAVLHCAECAVVANCGHMSHEEAPQQLLGLLVPFCSLTGQPSILHQTSAACVTKQYCQ